MIPSIISNGKAGCCFIPSAAAAATILPHKLSACILAILLLLSLPAHAANEEVTPPYAQLQGWSLGPLLLVVDQPYRGKDTRIIVVPAIGYQSEYAFVQGLRFGVHMKRSRRLSLDVLLQPRFSAFKASDIKDVPGLENRRDSVDAGFDLRVNLQGEGALRMMALTDVLDRSNGQEFDLRYEYSLRFGSTRISPRVGARWLSSKLTAYSYGTLPSEVARGAPHYQPGAVILPQVGVSAFVPLEHSKWSIFTLITSSFLPARLRDSPLVGGDTATTFIASASYHF